MLIKIMLNRVISTPDAKFMTIDISNFYLNTAMTGYEYLKLKLCDIPEKIIQLYKQREKKTPDVSTCVEIRKGIYSLPQAVLIANELLKKRLAKHEYIHSKIVPVLWTHNWRPIQLTLVVDDFGV